MKIIGQVISRRWRPERAAVAGLLATTAYSIAMEGDMAITRNRFSDVRFIQGLMGKRATAQKKFLVLAWILHMLNGVALAELDRKSTRLNSSHRCISYAVFCLK